MLGKFTYSRFLSNFSTDDACLEECKKQKYPEGIYCIQCNDFTRHFRIKSRKAYSCKNCRHQVYPLKGTILEKSTTPLRIWFYAIFIMTHARGQVSARQLQKEIGVTYKTAWRMHKNIKILMLQGNADLTIGPKDTTRRWTFLGKLEITFTQKQDN